MAARILAGEEAGSIPVTMMRDGRIFLNVQTARRIGVSPPFEVIIEAVLIGAASRDAAEMLDLFTVMDAAQAQNRDIMAAENAVEAGSKQVNVVRSDLLPQLDLQVSGELIDQDNAEYFPTLSEQTLRGGLNLTQILYSDGAWANYTIEKHRQDARAGELDRVRLDVGLEAASAYLGLLIAETNLQIQRQNLTYSRTNLERAEIRVAVGDANRSELYRWQSKIATEQRQVVDAATRRHVAAVELNRVLNRPLEDVLDLEDTSVGDPFDSLIDPRVDEFMQDPQSLTILRDFFVRKGLLAAPELQQVDAAIKAQERAHTAATRSFWVPNLGLSGSLENVFARGGEGSPLADEVPDDVAWNVGVFLSLPLLEGGGRWAESQRTTLEVYRLEREREAVALRIEQAVRSTTFQAAASRINVDLARRSAEAARLNLELVADNYTLGRMQLVDLIDAQTNALNADLASADAVNQYLLDLMRVERSIGQFTFYASTEERGAWIRDLEEYSRQSR
jgi:outer membrane protein TolC